MYMEKKAANQFLAAVDRLIECTKTSFSEEEALMELLASSLKQEHRDAHNTVLAGLMLLRRCVTDSDRSRLLAQLIVVDRQLTSHLSDAYQAPAFQPQDGATERCNDASAELAESHA
jgi:hemerythrin